MPPGKYNVHLEKFEDNKIQKLSEVQKFDIFQIGSKSTQEEREILYEFQIKFDKLISNVNNLVDDIDEAINYLDGEINKSLNLSSESDLEKNKY